MLRPSFRSVSAIAVLSVFLAFECRPLPAQEVDDVIVGGSARPLDAFSHYIGTWAHPDREGMTVTMRWVFEGRVIEWEEVGPSPSAPEPALFSRGLVGFDAATDQIVFQDFFGGQPHQFFGRREMMFKGTYTPLGGDRLQRTFTAFYGEGWNDRPPAGSQIQFRETWEPLGRDGWRWSSEILRDGTWGEYQPPVVMRRVPGESDGR